VIIKEELLLLLAANNGANVGPRGLGLLVGTGAGEIEVGARLGTPVGAATGAKEYAYSVFILVTF
jgi:hypothetical protein